MDNNLEDEAKKNLNKAIGMVEFREKKVQEPELPRHIKRLIQEEIEALTYFMDSVKELCDAKGVSYAGYETYDDFAPRRR